jgi:hypothetical protein
MCHDLPAPSPWEKAGVVPADPVSSGPPTLKYLAPDLFRVALRNPRLLKLEDGRLTVQDTDAKTAPLHPQPLPGEALLRRFLPHLLPPRFITRPYYGFLSSRHWLRLAQLHDLLDVKPGATPQPPHAPAAGSDRLQAARRCPTGGSIRRLVVALAPTRYRPPGARARPRDMYAGGKGRPGPVGTRTHKPAILASWERYARLAPKAPWFIAPHEFLRRSTGLGRLAFGVCEFPPGFSETQPHPVVFVTKH